MSAKPTPEDSLWTAILLKDSELKSLNDDAVRGELRRGGFPEPLIERYLQERELKD